MSRRRGFTLVEVLIALALLSLLMLTLTSAVRGMGQTETRVDSRIEVIEDYRLATNLLRPLLTQVSGRTYRPLSADARNSVPFFQGNAQALHWIGVMPARYGAGGRHYLRLAVETVGDQPRWVLRYAPWTGAPTFDQWDSADALALTATPLSAHLQYRHAASGQWHTTWPPLAEDPGDARTRQQLHLPDAVRIDFDGPTPAWPPLLLAVRANYSSDPDAKRATFGGGG